MLRCAITGGTASGFVNRAQIERLPVFAFQDQVRRWSSAGIDFIQLREKNLEPGALLLLAEAAHRAIVATASPVRLLINARADVAIAARADGVHLTAHAGELTPDQVRVLFAHAGLESPRVSVSCHTIEEVIRARENGADLILFGPVFEKQVGDQLVATGVGLEALADACRAAHPIPVLALGGVTEQSAPQCTRAGAAGIAGIRTFL